MPKWLAIPSHVVIDQIPVEATAESIHHHFQNLEVPAEWMEKLAAHFGSDFGNKTYAVRSSAVDEDGKQHSFAGQFETFLHVPSSQIEEKIKGVWQSATSGRVMAYRKENNLSPQWGIAVIVQEMVDADISGVAFGIDPVSGDKHQKVISSLYGLGEGLVSGQLDADTFRVKAGEIESELAAKKTAFVKAQDGSGVATIEIEPSRHSEPSLTPTQIKEVALVLDKLETAFGSPQDVEFAYQNEKLYLLQSRPITTQKEKANDEENGEYILWDNSNIIESYPGVTTPLTFSFIEKMYERVYRQFVGILGVREKEIEQHKQVFANTLGLVRGGVYYNLLSWYKMLAMVPGYSLNAEFMENMMGVKERFELKEDYRMSKGLARWRIVSMVFNMLSLMRKLPKERKRFLAYLNQVMSHYKGLNFKSMSVSEIVKHYKTFEETLLLKWKAPLINDFFAMIWFGLLQKQTAKLCPNEPNIHNDLLCGSQDIISVEPIHRTMAIAKLVSNNADAFESFKSTEPEKLWQQLEDGSFPEIHQAICDYIERFGDRCVGELKLETLSYSQVPAQFVKVVQSYVKQGLSSKSENENGSSSNLEDQLRLNAENSIGQHLKGKSLKRWWFNLTLGKARDLVSNRENLRYERTRGFGMVRQMFSALGKELEQKGHLNDARDVFYLKLDEIKQLDAEPFPSELRETVKKRKAEFARYSKQPSPEERFFTYGHNFTDDYIYSKEKLEPIEGDLKGIGCCPGRIKANIQVVENPNDIDSLNGDILVTSSTDPGWVTLFPTASGIIVERGSLLSHSAIVSREMGIPCIVSVTGLLRSLKTGDEVLMDGSTGEIKRIEV